MFYVSFYRSKFEIILQHFFYFYNTQIMNYDFYRSGLTSLNLRNSVFNASCSVFKYMISHANLTEVSFFLYALRGGICSLRKN